MSKIKKGIKYANIYSKSKINYPIIKIFNQEKIANVLFIESFSGSGESLRKYISRTKFKVQVISADDNVKKKLKEISKAHFIFCDNFEQTLGFINTKNKKIVLYWHANGAIKKFGVAKNKFNNENSKASNIHQKTYDKYTHVIVGSDAMGIVFTNAMNIQADKIFKIGNPLVDYAFMPKFKEECLYILKNNDDLIEKKTILYAPSFRDDQRDMEEQVDFLQELHEKFGDKYLILYKFHPKFEEEIDISGPVEIPVKDLKFYINIVDLLITDYSSIAMERCIHNKPLYYYMYDYEKYSENPGLFMSVQNLGGEVFYTQDDIFSEIDNFKIDKEKMEKFNSIWNKYNSTSTSKKIITEILLNTVEKGEK